MTSNVNLFSTARSGSTYLLKAISEIQKKSSANSTHYGEFFGPKSKDYNWKSIDQKVQQYINITKLPGLKTFKILTEQLPEVNFIENTNKIFNASNTENIFLYRADILDSTMSFILSSATGIWNSKHTEYPLHSPLNLSDEWITTRVKWYVDQLRKSLLVYSNFKFNYVLKYENFSGIPENDFVYYNNKHRFKTTPGKLVTKQDKEKLLNVQLIRKVLNTELKKHDIPQVLDLPTTGISNLNFLKRY